MVDSSYIYLFLVLVCVCSQHTNGGSKDMKRTLRWVTKPVALKYLTQEMSNMDDFKANILKPIMKERVSGTPGNVEVQEFIKARMTTLGWDVEEDSFEDSTPFGTKKFNNIIATYDSSRPRKIVIACHFDSKYYPQGGFMGAIDSAVPCAIMIETARQLSCLLAKGTKDKSSVKDITLQLLFLDGEEAFKRWTDTDSIYGARHLADRWSKEFVESGETKLSKIREFILLDLIGTSDTHIPKQFHDTSEVFDHLVKAETYLKEHGYLKGKSSRRIFSELSGYGRIGDDHVPFMDKGVPIVHLISSPFPKVWHTMADNWNSLDFELIDDFSRIFRLFVSNLLHLQPENQGCRKK